LIDLTDELFFSGLGRTEIIKADASKQAAAGYLGLSEGAVDAIRSFRLGLLEQPPLCGYKPEFAAYPLSRVLTRGLKLWINPQ